MSFQGAATGLYSSPNPFNASPAGSLAKADNVRYTAPSVIEPRPGNPLMTNGSFGASDSVADAMAFYGAAMLVAYDLTKVALSPGIGSAFTSFSGTFAPVGANRMRFELAARCVWFNTSTGLWVWDGIGVSSQPTLAGNPQGLSLSAVNVSANGWQTPDSAVAYRYTICSKDAHGKISEGPPSGRFVLRNKISSAISGLGLSGTLVTVTTGGVLDGANNLQVGDVVTLSPGEASFPAGAKTISSILAPNIFRYFDALAGPGANSTIVENWNITRSASVTCQLPTTHGALCSTANFLRIYRSDETLTAADTPDDELFLCYESPYLTATNISNGYFTFSDTAPTSSLDVPLNTNPNTGDGSLAANFQPPHALDTAYFANAMWFANTKNKHQQFFSMLGVGSPDGVQAGDTITIKPHGGTPIVFTAVLCFGVGLPVLNNDEFYVFTVFDPGLNIERTAQSLVNAINVSSDNPSYYAYYVSAEGGVPGKMLIQATQFDDALIFDLFASRYASWNPQLPPVSSPPYLVTSDNNRHPAGLWNSKVGQPEAVPILNYRTVYADNDAILRIFPLHYRLLIFKTDGIYSCTDTEPFSIQKLSSFKLIAPDSLAVLEEELYCLTDQGIVAIGNGGVRPVSVPIDDLLVALGGNTSLASLKTRCVGVAYRTARQYILWLIEKDDLGAFSTDNAQALVYSTLSKGFTRYPFGARAAMVDGITDRLVIAPTDVNQLLLENKTLTNADYFDGQFAIGTASAISGKNLTFSAFTVLQIAPGDVLGGDTDGATHLVIASSGTTVTTAGNTGWIPGVTNITLYRAFECEVQFNPLTSGEPAVMKMSNQVSFLFRKNGMLTTTAEFHSEITPADVEVPLTGQGWGAFPWGEIPWGGYQAPVRRVQPLPPSVDNCCQLSVGFKTRQAMAKFEFLGIDTRAVPDTDASHS